MSRMKTWTGGLRLGIALMSLSHVGCVAAVGVNVTKVPKNAAKICAGHCQSIGMRLSAVAIMADNVGCVCQSPSESESSANEAGEFGTPAAGMATIAAQEAATAALQASQRRQQPYH